MADEQKQDEDYIEIKIPSQEPAVEQEAAPKKEKPEPKSKAPAKKATKKKAVKKKTAKKPIQPKKKKAKRQSTGNSNWLWAVLLVIGLAVIAAVIFLSLQKAPVETQEEKQVAALVNNQPIYQEEIDEIFENLPASMSDIDKEVILDQLIEQEILVQEAASQGISISDEELQAYIDELLVFFGVPKSQFDAALEAQGMTREQFEYNSERQLIVNTLVNETVYPTINITEEDIEARYEAEKELFAVPASVIVKHILLTPKDNESEDDFKVRAEELMDMIDDDFANFCDLVTEYTADLASTPTCGEYQVMQNGQYVPEFEAAAFAMDVDDLDIAETDFGYHIMWKTGETEAGILELEEVTDQVENLLFQEAASEKLAKYIAELRDNAIIEKYPEATEEVETAPLTVEEDEELEEEMEIEVEETKPIREGNFGTCLAEQEAVMYGLSWSPDVTEQEEILGEAFEEVTYVDCDPAEGTAPAICDDISVYPTWIIGSGEDALVLEGKQSINSLSRETGCQA